MDDLKGLDGSGHPFPKDRNFSIKWARKTLARPFNFVILDTETTGINKTDEIIEIGIIDLAGNTLYESRFNPIKRRIHEDAKAAHGLALADLKGCPTFGEKWEEILSVLEGRELICYNIEFDGKMLGQTGEKHGVTKKANLKGHCAMHAYASFIGEVNSRKKGYKWHKLPSATHGAVGDCQATLKVIKHIASAKLHLAWWERLIGVQD